MNTQERQLLINFLFDLKSLLSNILDREMLNQRYKQDIVIAFQEINRLWDEGASLIASNEFDAKLDQVGLSGAQLSLKLNGFNNAMAAIRPRPTSGVSILKYVRRALKWANIILGSLVKVLIQLEPIKELKECVEEGIAEGIEDTGSNLR